MQTILWCFEKGVFRAAIERKAVILLVVFQS